MTICHPRREPLCGSVRRFPVLGGNFSRGAGRAAYKGVQRVKMLRNVEVFKGYKSYYSFLSSKTNGQICPKVFPVFRKNKKADAAACSCGMYLYYHCRLKPVGQCGKLPEFFLCCCLLCGGEILVNIVRTKAVVPHKFLPGVHDCIFLFTVAQIHFSA